MGCICFDDSNHKEKDTLSKLTSLKGKVMTAIELNDIKISKAEKTIENIDS
jgi:hypothetical protein